MFVPKVAKAQTKSADFQAHRRSTPAERQPSREDAEAVSGPQPATAIVSWDFSNIPARSDPTDGWAGQAGRPLDLAARRYFEPRFGQDFSRVRIYSDGPAARSASALGARAYTVGEAIIFNEAEYSLESPSGRRLVAHELAHVVQQRRGGAAAPVAGNPNLEAAAQSAANDVTRGTSVTVTGSAALGIARQSKPEGTAGASAGQPEGDAARPIVEALLKAFAAATGSEKNRIGMQAVREVISAYRFSTTGLTEMHFEPGLTKYDGMTYGLGDAARRSRIEFGPGSFNSGFEWFVHVIAHELEHVAQNLIGDYRQDREPPKGYPVAEFLSYSGEVLQVAPTPGRPRRGLLGELRAPTTAPMLPPLPPEQLAGSANRALSNWRKMNSEEQQRYWPQFESARDKLLERISKEAPPALRPPTSDRSSPAFAKWRDSVPNVYDPLSPEYDPEVVKSPWSKAKDQWKEFEKEPRRPAAEKPNQSMGGVVP
jgi:hypothetical protein